MNSLLYGENEDILKIYQQLPTILIETFHKIYPKSFSKGFLLIFKFSKNCLKTQQECHKN